MKKLLLSVVMLLGLTTAINTANAQRYLTEVFSSVSVTHDVTYGQNISVLLAPQGIIDTIDLKADVYEPVGDTMTHRPCVIMLHTGSFLPIFYNGQATGIKTDSTNVEMCRQFARRGYTAISMDYRLGWNPQALGSAGQDIRTGTLLQAVYRALQDAKYCVRYFRYDAQTSNTFHIDEQNIILGGVGSGGYIAFAYATLNDPAQIALPKFLAATSNPAYAFTAGQSYINQAVWGDFEGNGGSPGLNLPDPMAGTVSSDVAMIFNMGGALGDSSWIQSGNVPMLAFHVTNDPFAPYKDGPVIVPTTGDFVVDVSGSWRAIRIADSLGLNSCFTGASFTDPYTVRANAVNDGYDGLFPFEMEDPIGPAPGQAGPWDYFDSTTVYMTCMFGLGFTQGHTDTIWANSLLTNPDMSFGKSQAYIDTIMNYLNPRIYYCRLSTGIDNQTFLKNSLTVYPNPATSSVNIKTDNSSTPIRYIHMYDISGRLIRSVDNIHMQNMTIDLHSISAGSYTLKIGFDAGEVVEKLAVQ
ncbi:MAG: T9SS type A sorting domain-containing protein [Bacteroidetes bacterium]|nr:T9SS type A sorting domain-containing protein [Bacteroidota bacterium]